MPLDDRVIYQVDEFLDGLALAHKGNRSGNLVKSEPDDRGRTLSDGNSALLLFRFWYSHHQPLLGLPISKVNQRGRRVLREV